MKKLNRTLLLLTTLIISANPVITFAQSGFSSEYTFEGTIADDTLMYDLSLTGTDSFATGNGGQIIPESLPGSGGGRS